MININGVKEMKMKKKGGGVILFSKRPRLGVRLVPWSSHINEKRLLFFGKFGKLWFGRN